ncbi:unnamed protein product [Candida verbasci]|uniref:Phospholipid/glycerol acyltransferase domain-containing protein n=1 Tax=Candida verbasci TaxID=1227364 RepID=A0A9W4XAU5_9ASCO|nr:unnamed protein product [Candida verbasci]
MEIIDHLGLSDKSKSRVLWFKGLICLLILFYFTVLYQLVAILSLGLSILFPDTANLIRNYTGNLFWNIGLHMMKSNRVKFKIYGDKLDANPAIVICNHSSLADTFIIHYLSRFSYKNKVDLPNLNFFSWFLVWRVPTIKIILHWLKCDENWEIDEKSVLFVFSRLLKSKFSEWIILFPEVNIWTKENVHLQTGLQDKYFLPKFENVLYPRFSSFYNIITALNNSKPHSYSNLYDLTILYTKDGEECGESPTLMDFLAADKQITIFRTALET